MNAERLQGYKFDHYELFFYISSDMKSQFCNLHFCSEIFVSLLFRDLPIIIEVKRVLKVELWRGWSIEPEKLRLPFWP